MKLSFIIISYNTKDILRDCLFSIQSSKMNFDYEIIIVDNNSKDGSPEMIKQEFPDVKLIQNKDNKLFAIANNQGVEIASGEYVLLLNSDTLVYDDNIEKLVNYYDSLNDDVICVGPKILNKDKTLQSEGSMGMTHWDMIVKHFKLGLLLPSFIGKFLLPSGTYKFNRNTPHKVSWVTGCCMLIKRNLYNKVGGLNENLEFYGEEPEFGYRTSKLGYSTIYYPLSEIVHLGGASTDKKVIVEDSLRRYAIIVEQTVGYKYAIWTSRITKFSYQLKYLISRNKNILDLIEYENKVIDYLKRKI